MASAGEVAMPRIRTIKPEFWGDEKLAPLPPSTRLVFLGLISMADDAGRVVDSVKTVDGFIFPETDDSAREALDTLASLGRILRYKSESGQRLIQITGWRDHQKVDRPSAHVLPAPPSAEEDDARETVASPAREGREVPSLRPTTNDHGPGTMDHGATTTDQPAADDDDTLRLELVRAANRGMLDNPAIGQRLNPIPHGHGSAVELDEALARADVAPTFAISWVYTAAKTFRPHGRNRQIRSLSYFRDGLLSAWEQHEAMEQTGGPAPALLVTQKPNGNGKHAGPKRYDYSEAAASGDEEIRWTDQRAE